jgi:hypothetical protein
MPIVTWVVQQIIGKGWQAKDFRANDPKAVQSYLSDVRNEMYKGLDVRHDTDAMRAQARADVRGGQSVDVAADTLRGKVMLKRVIDATIKRAWVDYKRTYLDLYGKQKRGAVTATQPVQETAPEPDTDPSTGDVMLEADKVRKKAETPK